MNNGSEDIIQSKKVLELLTVANEICIFVEEAETYNKDFVMLYLQKVLPLLYLKGSLLPEISVSDESASEKFVTEEQWEEVFNRFRRILGEDDHYYIPDDSDPLNIRPRKSSISDNLADIYQNLKDFLLLYKKNSQAARENAVAECRKLFSAHWGIRLAYAHTAIHKIIYRNSEISEADNFSLN
jgi:hypothetical protein